VTDRTVSVSPASGAVESLARTSIPVGPASSGIVAVSTTAVGGLLSATRTATEAVAVPPFPSEIV
jgi:hypothetical protein